MKTISFFPLTKIARYSGNPKRKDNLLYFGGFEEIQPIWKIFSGGDFSENDVISRIKNRTIVRIQGVSESFIVKAYRLSARDSIFQWIGIHRKNRGLELGNGEALNTFIANSKRIPAHKLVAYICARRLHFFPHYQVLFFRDLLHHKGLDLLAREISTNSESRIIDIIIETLSSVNLKGIYHGDANISNILYSTQEKRGKLIDFELSMNFKCSPHIALMLQFTCTWDWRLKNLVEYDSYKSRCIDHLKSMVDNIDTITYMERIFEIFTSKEMRSVDRENRLKAVACGDDLFLYRIYIQGEHGKCIDDY